MYFNILMESGNTEVGIKSDRGCNSHGGYLDEGGTLITTIFHSKELVGRGCSR